MNQGTLQSLLVEDADKKRLEELRAFVIYHNHRYHTLDAPEITTTNTMPPFRNF